jgi:endonuclease YncB( thermonuclease family)
MVYLKISSHKRHLMLLTVVAILLIASISFAREPICTVTGTVTKVSDGDTIQVTTPDQTKPKVRLYGVDALKIPKANQSQSERR